MRAVAAILPRILRLELLAEAIHRVERLRERHTGFDARVDVDLVADPAHFSEHHRRPEIDLGHPLERCRQHADDFPGVAVDPDPATDDVALPAIP